MEKGKSAKLFPWSDDSIRWYKNATEYCGYHKALAEMLIKRLPENPRVCDMGCGMGALSVELAPFCYSVSAIDVNERALNCLKAQRAERGIDNLYITHGDFEQLSFPAVPFDAVIFCLFGNLPQIYERAKLWADKKIFFIVNTAQKRKFSVSGSGRAFGDEVVYSQYLNEIGAKFELDMFSLPFGQPFVDMDDALRFTAYYNPGADESELHKFLDGKLEEIDDEKYTLYLPSKKDLALFSIDV